MSKTVYQTDADGIFIGTNEAVESPLEPGVFHIPAGCVDAEPPLTSDGEVAVWTGSAWQKIADHRGETWYLDGAPVVISAIGDPADDGYEPTPPPPPPPTIAELKAYAAKKRFAIETGGVTVGGAKIDTSRESQAMITGAYAYAQANPDAPIDFKAASGWVALTATEIEAIATTVGAHVQACFAAEKAVDEAIDAGTVTTTAAIDDWAWPANS